MQQYPLRTIKYLYMTISLGDISVRYVNLLFKTAKHCGIDIEPFKRQFQLSDTKLSQADARISIPKFMRLGHAIMEDNDLNHLGLLSSLFARPSLFSWAGFLAECAPTLQQSLTDIAVFETLSSKNARGRSQFYTEGHFGIAEFYSISPYNDYNYFIVDMALAVEFAVIQQIAGTPIQPSHVQVEFAAPSYAHEYSELFSCPVKFNQKRNALVFKLADLEKIPFQENSNTYCDCQQLCLQKKKELLHEQSFVERVMNEISPLLSSPHLSMEQVALGLEMPPWTLRRRLKEEGTNFKKLLDETRGELARLYLRNEHYSLGEITYLLGFANPNAFQRAFKRWESIPPGEYRLKLNK